LEIEKKAAMSGQTDSSAGGSRKELDDEVRTHLEMAAGDA
jgi:hypothetical protein